MKDEAFDELVKGLEARGDSAAVIREVKEAYRSEGFSGIAKLELRQGFRFDEETRKFNLAVSYVMLGDNKSAIDFLEKSYDERQYHVVTLKVGPGLGPPPEGAPVHRAPEEGGILTMTHRPDPGKERSPVENVRKSLNHP